MGPKSGPTYQGPGETSQEEQAPQDLAVGGDFRYEILKPTTQMRKLRSMELKVTQILNVIGGVFEL